MSISSTRLSDSSLGTTRFTVSITWERNTPAFGGPMALHCAKPQLHAVLIALKFFA
jgi:hypothetical protein